MIWEPNKIPKQINIAPKMIDFLFISFSPPDSISQRKVKLASVSIIIGSLEMVTLTLKWVSIGTLKMGLVMFVWA
jgi:hypothetical protein